jgi:serine/threonine protein kinase
MPLRQIGGYEVLDLIGQGGMGAVYRGRDPRFDRLVAVKVLHPQFQRDPDVIARFKSEAVIQAKLNPPSLRQETQAP